MLPILKKRVWGQINLESAKYKELTMLTYHFESLKVERLALAMWLSVLEPSPVHQKVAGLIPGRATYRS